LQRGAPATILLLCLGMLVASGVAPASASSADDYANSVHRALTLVQFAERGDVPSVQQAIDVLTQDTGNTQLEILRDLHRNPPDLGDADQRLQALYATLQTRVDCTVYQDFTLTGITPDGQATGTGCVYPAVIKTLPDQLKAAGKTCHAYIYPGVEHGFNNDTTPRFNKEAASLAWARTMELFKRKLA